MNQDEWASIQWDRAKKAAVSDIAKHSPNVTVRYGGSYNVTVSCSLHGWSRTAAMSAIRHTMKKQSNLCPFCRVKDKE